MPRGRPSSDPVKLVRLALAAIDTQIAELQEKRAQLAAIVAGTRLGRPAGRPGRPPGRRPGRPPGRLIKVKAVQKAVKRRKVSAATRRRLSEAAKQRWARERMSRS